MPWKECSVMEERLRFVGRLLDGEAMTDVCREFGISRKTGYKIFDRYKEHGLEALSECSCTLLCRLVLQPAAPFKTATGTFSKKTARPIATNPSNYRDDLRT